MVSLPKGWSYRRSLIRLSNGKSAIRTRLGDVAVFENRQPGTAAE